MSKRLFLCVRQAFILNKGISIYSTPVLLTKFLLFQAIARNHGLFSSENSHASLKARLTFIICLSGTVGGQFRSDAASVLPLSFQFSSLQPYNNKAQRSTEQLQVRVSDDRPGAMQRQKAVDSQILGRSRDITIHRERGGKIADKVQRQGCIRWIGGSSVSALLHDISIAPKNRASIPDHCRLSIVRFSVMGFEYSDISITWEVSGRGVADGWRNRRQCEIVRAREGAEPDSLLFPQKTNAV